MRPIIFGEVLYDRFANGDAILGGAPFNVAWNLQAFGLAPLFISSIGDDALGAGILTAMRDWGMDVDAVQTHAEHPTGVVDVTVHDGEPAYDIVSPVAYDFIQTAALPPLPQSTIVYHGSLALRGETSWKTLQHIGAAQGSVFLDVNLRPPWWEKAHIQALMAQATWLKVNEDELQLLAEGDSMEARVAWLLQQNAALENVIVTLGAAGASLTPRGGSTVSATPEPRIAVVDTVGAGDAFSSVMLLSQVLGWPVSQALQRAQQFAGAVVGLRGATTQDKSFYQPFMQAWR